MAAPFRLLPKSFTLAEISKHNSKDDAWIVVNNKVYDITGFVQTHHGWELGGGVSTLLSILRNLGTDCSQVSLSLSDFDEAITIVFKLQGCTCYAAGSFVLAGIQ